MPDIIVPNTGHLDAGETQFFTLQLSHILAKVFEQRFPALKGRMLFPVNNEAGPGAEFILWDELNFVGVAELIADYATALKRVDANMTRNNVAVRQLGDAFGFSVNEIQKAARARMNLQANKAKAALMAAEQKVDRLIFFGDAATGLVGIFSHPNIPYITLPADGNSNGGTNSTRFRYKTPDQIIRDVASVWNSIRSITNDTQMANTLVMPVDQYTQLYSTPRSSTTDTTILTFLKENLEGCENIVSSGRCKNAVSGTDAMFAYEKSSETAEVHIPVEFKEMPPQMVNLEWVINCLMDFAGLVVYRPLAYAIAGGI